MPTIPVKTTYLTMNTAPEGEPRKPPREDLLLLQSVHPTVAWYRFLYREVGRDLMWVDLNFRSDEELAADLADPAVTVRVLFVAGVPAGFYDLFAEADGSIRLALFGLMPAFRGQRLGGWLLDQAIYEAWSRRPTRLWLHTCELDAPAALPTYLQAGFSVTHVEVIAQRIEEPAG